nr:MAG TPA: hypothetical protein [Caudoviricetes sp.]
MEYTKNLELPLPAETDTPYESVYTFRKALGDIDTAVGTDRASAEVLKARIAALEEKVNQIFSSQTISLDDVPSDIHDGGFVVLKK